MAKYYHGFSDNQQSPPPPASNNFVFNLPQPQPPPSQIQHFVGIPLHGQHDVSAFHGFLPRNLYNQHIDIAAVAAAREVSGSHKGLSLSLSSQQPASYSVKGVHSVLFDSKYLKAAQEILEEVVKVEKGAKILLAQKIGETSGGGGEESKKVGAQLSTAERQDIRMKNAKLVNMLDEVEHRYRQYHNDIQIVISWFEPAAGIGSAKTYTALALQTISKQFRCLKDAILGQIRAATKSLGDEETEGSKLKYVDNQIRQQRALQQLGMIQNNAWRPQRGLPERSVSLLRAWLFEHFLHPYPKDSDKLMLAKQTGLTRSQVSNWFINARVRLWKPMVEEMYLEEIKEQGKNGLEHKSQNEDSSTKNTAPQVKNPAFENQNISRNESASVSTSTVFTSPDGVTKDSDFHLIGSSELANFTQKSPKKPRYMSMKLGNERQSRDEFTLIGAPTNFIGGFGSYPIRELGRFGEEQFQAPYSGNGVSLTLGLLHQNFMPNQSIQLERGRDDSNDFGGMIV